MSGFSRNDVVGNRPSACGHLVVEIGASAADLVAYQSFFKAMPDHSGMTFVLIQHFEPNNESALVKITAQRTAMPVVKASEGMIAAPNTVFSYLAERNLEDR